MPLVLFRDAIHRACIVLFYVYIYSVYSISVCIRIYACKLHIHTYIYHIQLYNICTPGHHTRTHAHILDSECSDIWNDSISRALLLQSLFSATVDSISSSSSYCFESNTLLVPDTHGLLLPQRNGWTNGMMADKEADGRGNSPTDERKDKRTN